MLLSRPTVQLNALLQNIDTEAVLVREDGSQNRKPFLSHLLCGLRVCLGTKRPGSLLLETPRRQERPLGWRASPARNAAAARSIPLVPHMVHLGMPRHRLESVWKTLDPRMPPNLSGKSTKQNIHANPLLSFHSTLHLKSLYGASPRSLSLLLRLSLRRQPWLSSAIYC